MRGKVPGPAAGPWLALVLALGTGAPVLAQETAAPDQPAAVTPLPGVVQRPAPPPPPERSFDDLAVAELQGLDKITARISSFSVPVGQSGRFGQLEVTVKACKKAPPIDPPESAAFLEITERRPDEGPAPVFRGWMFASSPAVSAMDHPVYDVWVVDCKSAATRSSSPKAG